MINIAFFPPVDRSWMGGANYFKNLFHAVAAFDIHNEFSLYCCVGNKTDRSLIDECYSKATIVRSSAFDHGSVLWFLSKISSRLLKYDVVVHVILLLNKIDVVSHSSPSLPKSIKKIGWIPDFQHVFLPSFFSKKEIAKRDRYFKHIANNSDYVFLSSYNALRHFEAFFDEVIHPKACVLQFVSQVGRAYFDFKEEDKLSLISKYSIPEDYLYVPNQIWQHKNHKVILEAAKILKESGAKVCFVCSGNLEDYRAPGLFRNYQDYLVENELGSFVRFLGSIPYSDVLGLMRFSRVVVNPSLFEGWSSTVEECKSADKRMILSDIDVHKEQYPEASFFKVDDPSSLAAAVNEIKPVVCGPLDRVKIEMENNSRTKEFFENYRSVVKKVIDNNQGGL